MSMILKSYDEGIVLPPEGTEEWLALLPGWSGWRYQEGVTDGESTPLYYFMTMLNNPNTGNVYWNIWEGLTGSFNESNTGYVGDVFYAHIGGYYYFRGEHKKNNFILGNWYAIARATSLEPKV